MGIILKNCPFCGQEPDFTYNLDLVPDGIKCRTCHIVVRYPRIRAKPKDKFEVVMQQMADCWNRRA